VKEKQKYDRSNGGMSMEDIAVKTDMSQQRVSQLIRSAKRKMIDHLTENDIKPEDCF